MRNVRRLLVNGVYEDIQREGILSGYHTLFVRLQGCSMQCKWCNVPQTWKFDKRKAVKCEKFTDDILRRLKGRHMWLCITGGEPMEQIEPVMFVIERLRRNDCRNISIETCGYPIPPAKVLVDLAVNDIFLSVSPKLPSIGASYSEEIFKTTLSTWSVVPENPHRVQFKFVVASKSDLEVVEKYLPVSNVVVRVEESRLKSAFLDECKTFVKRNTQVRLET